MTDFNVKSRQFLNVSIDDGPMITIEIEISTEGYIRVKHDRPLGPGQSVYLGLFVERKKT